MNKHITRARARIVLVVPSTVTADTLISSGAMDGLKERFDLVYLFAEEVAGYVDLNPKHVRIPTSLQSRLLIFLDIHFWYHALFIYLRRLRLKGRQSFKIAYMKPYQRWIHRVLALPPLDVFFSWLDRKVVFPSDPVFLSYLEAVRPDLVIIPGSAMDSYSHFVARSAERLGVPTLMIVSHWDYFSKKGLLRYCPQRVYVWGEDMRDLAIRLNGLGERTVRVVGAPHFQKYVQGTSRYSEARMRLGLEPGWRVLLFAGTSAPYDEVAVLKLLNDYLVASDCENVRILYRAHPRAWKRRLREDVDPRLLPRVLIDDISSKSGTCDDHFMDLMAAIDGIVSPFSTMILEAALCGRPAFCIGFGDGINPWNFSEANSNEHIAIMAGRSWLTVCTDRDLIEIQFAEFLSGLEKPGIQERIHAEIRRTIYCDDRSYAVRLRDAITQDFLSADEPISSPEGGKNPGNIQ